MLKIAPLDWSALLDHADAIDFFDHPEAALTKLSDRIFHLAINGPFEGPDLPIRSRSRRAVRDRQALSPDMLDDVQFAALAAAWLDL